MIECMSADDYIFSIMGLYKIAIIGALSATALFSIKLFTTGPTYKGTERLDGKVAIVTGANTGIGKETVLDFAKRGAKVYVSCRSEERAQKAIQDVQATTGLEGRLIFLKLDLSSLKSVRSFAKQFKQRETKLDILVNNAGIMFAPEGRTEDGYEQTMQVNHLGHFLLTHLLMDELMLASPSRIINVSSGAHKHSGEINFDDMLQEKSEYSTVKAYGQSKTANILFTVELARRLRDTGVTVYALHPGAVLTELYRTMPVYNYPLGKQVLDLVFYLIMKDSFHGAQTQIMCAVSGELEKESGLYYKDCAVSVPKEYATNPDFAKRLWNDSEKLVKLEKHEMHSKLQ